MELRTLAASICVVGLALAGCTNKYVEPDQYSGFLKDYSVLKEDKSPSGEAVMRWIDPDVNVNRYTGVYIEPSQFYPKPQPTAKISIQTLKGITDYYDQTLKNAFSKELPLAEGPGPGVLVVRPAITAVSAKTKSLRPYEVIPIALVAAGISAATGIRDQDTSLATEAAFLDSDSNKVVAEVVRKGAGTDLDGASQALEAKDFKLLLNAWASDVAKSFHQLKK
jgi:hypothetical protein